MSRQSKSGPGMWILVGLMVISAIPVALAVAGAAFSGALIAVNYVSGWVFPGGMVPQWLFALGNPLAWAGSLFDMTQLPLIGPTAEQIHLWIWDAANWSGGAIHPLAVLVVVVGLVALLAFLCMGSILVPAAGLFTGPVLATVVALSTQSLLVLQAHAEIVRMYDGASDPRTWGSPIHEARLEGVGRLSERIWKFEQGLLNGRGVIAIGPFASEEDSAALAKILSFAPGQ